MTTINNDKSGSYWKEVLLNTKDEEEWEIPNGETWNLQHIHGSGAGQDAIACLVWDGSILFCTITSMKVDMNFDMVGDGTKLLKIVLDNKTSSNQPMGISYIARKK